MIGLRPAGRGLVRARRLAGRRRARVRGRRRGRRAGQRDELVDVRDHRRRARRRLPAARRRATSATARCRGCRRSAGASTMRPYADERWWPLALMLVATAALVAGAVALRARRDEGAGHRRRSAPARRPRGRALTSPLGLAVRLQRGVMLGWSAGLFLSGVSLGLTGKRRRQPARRQRRDREAARLGAGDIVDQYFAVTMLTMALIGTGFGIQVALRMRARGDERPARAAARHRALARALGRRLRRGGDGRLAARARRQRARRRARRRDQQPRRGPAPAAAARRASCPRPRYGWWSARRCAVRARAARGRRRPGACSARACVLSILGPLLGLPDWVLDLSPFQHVPQLPAADFDAVPLLAPHRGRRGADGGRSRRLPPARPVP